MSSVFGPVRWYSRAKQSFHADAQINLPTGVTLSSPTGRVEQGPGGAVVSGVTVGDLQVVTGRLSAVAGQGVDYTLTPGTTPPAKGDGYAVLITATRSDGTVEVIEQPLTIA